MVETIFISWRKGLSLSKNTQQKLSRNDFVKQQSDVTAQDALHNVHDPELLSSEMTPAQLLPDVRVPNVIRPDVHAHPKGALSSDYNVSVTNQSNVTVEGVSHCDGDSQVNLRSDHDEISSEVVDEVRKMTVLNFAASAFIPATELKSDRNENTSHDILCAAAFTTQFSQEQFFQCPSSLQKK